MTDIPKTPSYLKQGALVGMVGWIAAGLLRLASVLLGVPVKGYTISVDAAILFGLPATLGIVILGVLYRSGSLLRLPGMIAGYLAFLAFMLLVGFGFRFL